MFSADLHTHSVASGHAFSTIAEMAGYAAANRFGLLAITDHGPAYRAPANLYYFGNLYRVPEYISGVRLLKGAEANVMYGDGRLDIPDEILVDLEFVIASLHDNCLTPVDKQMDTQTLIRAMENPFIDGIGHIHRPPFSIDISEVVRAAKEYNKWIEINTCNMYEEGVRNGLKRILYETKKQNVPVYLGSDAHICYEIGCFELIKPLLKEVGYPADNIVNQSAGDTLLHIKERRSGIFR